MSLTKADIIENLSQVLGFNKREARDLVDYFFSEVKLTLAQGKQLKFSGFGNFRLRDKKTRPGRNPKTGQEVPVSARRVVTFRAGHKLKTHLKATKTGKIKIGA